jgi:enamine deaminase RidA (YjgF/YER057c/UK114 family)
MSQIVIHGGIIYLSGQVDQEATDAEGQTKGEILHCITCMDESLQEKEPLALESEHSENHPPAPDGFLLVNAF